MRESLNGYDSMCLAVNVCDANTSLIYSDFDTQIHKKLNKNNNNNIVKGKMV